MTTGNFSRLVTASTTDAAHKEDLAKIERLMTHMFRQKRQAHSEKEKMRHVGVVFKHLMVKGRLAVGLGWVSSRLLVRP